MYIARQPGTCYKPTWKQKVVNAYSVTMDRILACLDMQMLPSQIKLADFYDSLYHDPCIHAEHRSKTFTVQILNLFTTIQIYAASYSLAYHYMRVCITFCFEYFTQDSWRDILSKLSDLILNSESNGNLIIFLHYWLGADSRFSFFFTTLYHISNHACHRAQKHCHHRRVFFW
jgi:hypothetical protein